MMEKYRTFYSLDEESNEEHKFTEVKDEFLPIIFPSESRSTLNLKVCFPKYEDPKDKGSLVRKTICHQLDLSVLRRILAQKKPG